MKIRSSNLFPLNHRRVTRASAASQPENRHRLFRPASETLESWLEIHPSPKVDHGCRCPGDPQVNRRHPGVEPRNSFDIRQFHVPICRLPLDGLAQMGNRFHFAAFFQRTNIWYTAALGRKRSLATGTRAPQKTTTIAGQLTADYR